MLSRKEQDYEYSKIQIPLYPPTIQNYRRGSALLAVVLILAMVSSVMSIGTAKITQAAINSTGSNKTTLQAQQYAASEAELLRSTNYSDLKAQNKQSISDSGFQKEILLSDESDLSGGIKKRDVTVNIYSDAESLPRSTVKLQRYSVEASDLDIGQPEYLGSGPRTFVAKEAGFVTAGGSSKSQSLTVQVNGKTLGYVCPRGYGTGTISACVPVPKGATVELSGQVNWAYWSKLKA